MRFAPEPRVVPDAWFKLLSEDARFPSREKEEQLRSKLQGFTVGDEEPGRGRPEASTEEEETEHETENETESETKDENETESKKQKGECKREGGSRRGSPDGRQTSEKPA